VGSFDSVECFQETNEAFRHHRALPPLGIRLMRPCKERNRNYTTLPIEWSLFTDISDTMILTEYASISY